MTPGGHRPAPGSRPSLRTGTSHSALEAGPGSLLQVSQDQRTNQIHLHNSLYPVTLSQTSPLLHMRKKSPCQCSQKLIIPVLKAFAFLSPSVIFHSPRRNQPPSSTSSQHQSTHQIFKAALSCFSLFMLLEGKKTPTKLLTCLLQNLLSL